MKCFRCEKGKMATRPTQMTGELRGESLTVETTASVCSKCGFQVLSPKETDAYNVALGDAYRVRHGLLTSAEIRHARAELRMSQRDFARYLKVGEASVKRWEAGLIQDEAMDLLIRLRSDPGKARQNVTDVEQRLKSGAPARRPHADGEPVLPRSSQIAHRR